MTDLVLLGVALQSAQIWYQLLHDYLSDKSIDLPKTFKEEYQKNGVKSASFAALRELSDVDGKEFGDCFEKACNSFIKRYEFDRELASVIIDILKRAERFDAKELNREVLMATLFSDKPRLAPIENYCQRMIGFDQIISGKEDIYTITEVARALRSFLEELQRSLMLSPRWREIVVQFRMLQLQSKIAGEYDLNDMREEYQAYLRDKHQYLDLKGFSPRVSNRILSLRLKEIFTNLTLIEGRPKVSEFADDELNIISEKKFFELDWIRQLDLLEKRYARLESAKPKTRVLDLADVFNNKKAVILGEPGSGKSTLTAYITLCLASKEFKLLGLPTEPVLPILVRIANFGRALEKEPSLHLIDYISQQLTPDFGPMLKQEITDGQCLIMLDGLDEVADIGQRQRVAECIEDLVSIYGNNRFLITSRPIGYQSAQLTGEFRHLTLNPLSEKDQIKFIHLWNKEISARGAGKSEENVFVEEDALIKAIKSKPGVAKLASNPLLLTIIVLMYWRGTKLPDRRVDIYASATETLIENWPLRQRGIDLDYEQIKSILAPVALSILSSSVSGVIAEHKLVPILTKKVQEVHGGTPLEAQLLCEKILTDLNEHSGIFLERGRDEFDSPVYGFLHQTFGEYLAALALAEQWNIGELTLSNYIHKAHWREVVLLLGGVIGTQGRGVVSRFINEIINLKSPFEDILHRDLLLSLELLGDDIRIQPVLRQAILNRSISLLENEVTDLRKSAADRIKRLKITDHVSAAIELLTTALQNTRQYPKDEKRNEIQLTIADILCELGDFDSAKPIIIEISNDIENIKKITSKVLGVVTKLRLLYWTEESIDWLISLFNEARQYRPRLIVGKHLSDTLIRTSDNVDIHVFDSLNTELATSLFNRLAEKVSDDDILQRIKWVNLQMNKTGPIDVELMLELADSQTDRQVCYLAACQLLELGYKKEGISALQTLCSEIDRITVGAAQKLLENDEPIIGLKAAKDLALFYAYDIQPIKLLIESGDKTFGFALLMLRSITFSQAEHQWRAIELLLELGHKDLALAGLRMIAFCPGHAYRYEAIEVLLDNQSQFPQFDDIIKALINLAFDSYDSDQGNAIARLATLHETKHITPILLKITKTGETTSQYHMANALVLGGLLELPSQDDIKISESIHRISEVENRKESFIKSQADYFRMAYQFLDKNTNSEINLFLELIKGIFKYEMGERGEAILILSAVESRCSSVVENIDKLLLFISRTWLSWGKIEFAYNAAVKVLTADNSSVATKNLAINLISRLQFKSVRDTLMFLAENDPETEVRINVIEKLIDFIDADVEKVLQKLFEDKALDTDARAKIARNMGRATVKAAKDILFEAVQDSEGDVRSESISALGELGLEDGLPMILKALSDQDESVRISASSAIQGIDSELPADIIVAHLLNETSKEVQGNLIQGMLLANPKEAEQFLIGSLGEFSQDVRNSVYRILSNIMEERSTQFLIDEYEKMDLSNADAVANLVELIGQRKNDLSFYFVESKLLFDIPEVRQAAIRAIGDRVNHEFNDRFVEAILNENDNAQIVTVLIDSLKLWGSTDLVSVLSNSLYHKNENVRERSIRALCNMSIYDNDFNYLAEYSNKLINMALYDTSTEVRAGAVECLAWIDLDSSYEVLPLILTDESRQIRRIVADWLGMTDTQSNISLLNSLIFDDDSGVQTCAVKSLRHLGAIESSDYLRLLLRSQSDDQLKNEVALGLACLGDATVVDDIFSLALASYYDSGLCVAISQYDQNISSQMLQSLLIHGARNVKISAAKCMASVSPQLFLETIVNSPLSGTSRFKTMDLGLYQAIAYHNYGDKPSAKKIFQNIIANIDKIDSPLRNRGDELIEWIIPAFELEYFSECVEMLNKAIQQEPRAGIYYADLGIVYRVQRDYKKSKGAYLNSLKLNPNGGIETFNGLGVLCYAEGNYEGAKEYFNKSLKHIFNSQSTFDYYLNDTHSIHMLLFALAGADCGKLALSKIDKLIPKLIFDPGVIIELTWDIQQLLELNPSLSGLPEIEKKLSVALQKIEGEKKTPLRSFLS